MSAIPMTQQQPTVQKQPKYFTMSRKKSPREQLLEYQAAHSEQSTRVPTENSNRTSKKTNKPTPQAEGVKGFMIGKPQNIEGQTPAKSKSQKLVPSPKHSGISKNHPASNYKTGKKATYSDTEHHDNRIMERSFLTDNMEKGPAVNKQSAGTRPSIYGDELKQNWREGIKICLL